MKNLNETITKLEELVSKIGVMSIDLIVFSNAILRYFSKPLVWAPDIAQLIFVWVVFIGADLALQQNKHIGIEILESRFSEKNRSLLRMFWCVLITIFLSVCIYYGITLCIANSARRLNGGVQISYSYLTAAVPVGSLLMIKTTIINMFLEIKNFKEVSAIEKKVIL